MPTQIATPDNSTVFSGNIFVFYAFDIGDDINFKALEQSQALTKVPYHAPKYFRNYHIPMAIELPHPHETSGCISAKLHHFGVISLIYKVPFNSTLEELRTDINEIDYKYQESSVSDANAIYKKIVPFVAKPAFFHLRNCYPVIQVDHDKSQAGHKLIETHGPTIASLLRFETQNLSANQMKSILSSAQEYYRGDLIIIDIEAAFLYDPDYEELLEIFEFANIQQLELQYFDRLLNQQLSAVYDSTLINLPWTKYLPFSNVATHTMLELGRLKIDISVITERLANSIKLTGEAYYSDIYELLVAKLDVNNWKASVAHKLEIIQDVRAIYQHQIDNIRDSVMNVLIAVLILIEVFLGVLHLIK